MSAQPTATTSTASAGQEVFEGYASKFTDRTQDIKTKLHAACDIRDSVDQFGQAEAQRFSPVVLPAMLQVLKETPVSFKKDSSEHLLRNTILEIFHRLPVLEQVKQVYSDVVSMMTTVLREDNEENGVVAVKIIMDANRAFKRDMDTHVQAFLDFVRDLYLNMNQAVQDLLSQDSPGPPPSQSSMSINTSTTTPGEQPDMVKAIASFKVLTECPIATVYLFQMHRTTIPSAVKSAIPLAMDFLQLQAPPQKQAHDDAAGRNEHWIGVSPLIKHRAHYIDFITAQTLSFVAYVLRGSMESPVRQYGEVIPPLCVRLLKDCPPESATIRRELMVATRHILSTEFRPAFVPLIDCLTSEHILIGTGVNSQETLRPLAYSMLGDLIHHIRKELSPEQLRRIIYLYSCCLHNPAFGSAIHNMSAKLLANLVDVNLEKFPKPEAAASLLALLETCVDKLGAVWAIHEQIVALTKDGQDANADSKPSTTGSKSENRPESPTKDVQMKDADAMDVDEVEAAPKALTLIDFEKAKPAQAAAFVLENKAEAVKESKVLFRTLLHVFKTVLAGIRTSDGPVPDGELIRRLFQNCVKCLTMYDDGRDGGKEAFEMLLQVFHEIEPHIFQEVWTTEMQFFIDRVQDHQNLLAMPQLLLSSDMVSHQLVAILLRYLVGKLDTLGEQSQKSASITLRLFKMCFMSVTVFPELNEPILFHHLSKLIMDSLRLATKAADPTNYFLLLRGLFRAMGGGKFESLYNEVLPLLRDMLESLNRQLQAAEPSKQDLLVELCLTVPVRLTNLLPFLSFLMRPLVHALRAGPELVAQGLRTLELCIDNLTQEFLDPTLSPVLRELMAALHSHLKPQPGNHQHAHTTVRILGKLGGRNRRLQHQEPQLEYQGYSPDVTLALNFNGHSQTINIGPTCQLAVRLIQESNAFYRQDAFVFVQRALELFLRDGIDGSEDENVFCNLVDSLFVALQDSELEEKAAVYIREVSEIIFLSELSQGVGVRVIMKTASLYMDRVPRLLSATAKHHVERAEAVFSNILADLLALEGKAATAGRKIRSPDCIFHPLGFNLAAACYEETWAAKLSGCRGIVMLADALGPKWTSERENSFIRAFLSVLKEMPVDPPREVEFIKEAIMKILRLCRQAPPLLPPTQPGVDLSSLPKLPHLIPTLTTELSSPIALVREMTQKSIEILAELVESTPSELLMKCKDRLLQPIFAKPLRALPISLQIGHIDGITYALNMKPPLPEMNDELLRLLSEALAIADAEDRDIVGPGRGGARSNAAVLEQLRVVCIKLLTSSMSVTEFFAKQMATRQKVTSVYFKSLYSPSNEVKRVAHEGLRTVLNHQSRLPKDILQTGLRPVLMNLADAKRLSVPGLEGLARLLELLTNYFKVEIGHKLLDHFRVIADPKMLSDAAYQPLADNDEITKLVRLVNIFHLLPPAANMFLEALVSLVVQVETALHSASPSPFTAALASFLDRFPGDALEYFYRTIGQSSTLRSLRNVISSGLAPNMNAELRKNTTLLVDQCLKDETGSLVLPGLTLCTELSRDYPDWLQEHPEVLDALLHLWRAYFLRGSEDNFIPVESFARHASLLLDLLVGVVERAPRVDVMFDIVCIYAHRVPLDLSRLRVCLIERVALGASPELQKEILQHFVQTFDGETYNWAHKTQFLRYIINPLLFAQLNARKPSDSSNTSIDSVDASILNGLHAKIWKPMTDQPADIFPGSDDGLKIEILYMSSLLIQSSSSLMQESRKDVIKCTWHYIVNDDATVKQTAYVTISRFFAVFDSPPKFLTRVWTGLLRPVNTDNRTLTKQAVDIMVPVLIKATVPDSGPPSWAKSVRRALIDEGHSITQLLFIYQIIVRNPDFFYPCRDLFIPSMISSLHKLGTVQTATSETRSNALDALELVLAWERRAIKESHGPEGSAAGKPKTWLLPFSMRETIISHLVRFITMTSLETDKLGLPSRALGILEGILKPGGWKDVDVQLQYFHRPMVQVDLNEPNHLPVIINATKVLSLIALAQDDSWLLSHAADLHALIEKGLRSDEPTLHEHLQPVLKRILALVGEPVEGEPATPGHAIHTFADTLIKDGLQHSQRQINGAYSCLSVLKTMVTVYPAKLEGYASPLMKVLQKLVKDHINVNPATNQAASESTSRLVTIIFETCRDKVISLGVERRWLLNAVILVVGSSQALALCHYVLGMVREWTLIRPDATPTLKEKAGMLKHMMAFEGRGDPQLLDGFLNLVYDIYTEPSLKRTDLTTRLESVFLMGCRAKDPSVRCKFIDLFDTSIQRTISSRLQYALGSLSWEFVAEHYWIPLALDLMLGAAEDGRTDSATLRDHVHILDSPLARIVYSGCALDIMKPLRRLLHAENQVAHELWMSTFRAVWAILPRREQSDASRYVLTLVTKDYHSKQCDLRPNVIQSILGGVQMCNPPLALPPFVVKYLGKTFNAWHTALEILQSGLDPHRAEEPHETTYDALAELYAELSEDDLFYGLWRRRSIFEETNAALAFEQNGLWTQAQQMYESAQIKARTGALPFNESEYCLWEDHWILSAQKLQQWDSLTELARSENNADLSLECIWRTAGVDREQIQELLTQVADVPTPRRRVFEAYIALTQIPPPNEKNVAFLRIMDESIQLSLRKWVTLPKIMSMAHVPLLQHFQQFVELQEAAQIFMSLSMTNAQNLEKRSSELKVVLQAWRERLPNLWDDIGLWSDLIAWRSHVFEMINKTYLPLIPAVVSNNTSNNSNTCGYRGYHETAWIINRFAHVARKHGLTDVCHTSLAKIYTLPNIEISEAFLKLREQAKCHYQNSNSNELTSGLEVINNTNLMYFSNLQKAEFYTLKGMFIAKLGNKDEANAAFQQSIQMDMSLAKGWAEWGRFSDRQFKEKPQEYSLAANAVQCYLQAASLYKKAKSRPILQRILWLLSVDDPHQPVVAQAFESFKGDVALWYWITLIPQLLVALSYRESKHARHLLMSIAKHYPQALFFHLRTTREEFVMEKKRLATLQNSRNARLSQGAIKPEGAMSSGAGSPPAPKPAGDVSVNATPSGDVASTEQSAVSASFSGLDGAVQRVRQPLDHVEDITSILKTGFPLLTLALETMVDQISMRMKLVPEEDICRQLNYLHVDAMMAYNRRCNSLTDDNSIPQQSSLMATNFARALQPASARAAFENDILMSKMSLRQYVVKLQKWRDRYDAQPEYSRTPRKPLQSISHWLTEFHHNKFEEPIEVPGQYLQHKDTPHGFVRIQRFASKVEFCRTSDVHFRRISMHGHDGSFHTFAVQHNGRHTRREERSMQLFRSFNAALDRRKETRKRNLNFHLPAAISFSHTLRLLENDSSYVTMQDMLDQHCKEKGIHRDDPQLHFLDKLKVLRNPEGTKVDFFTLRAELISEISAKFVPATVISNYMSRCMRGPMELWTMRKLFALQVAATSFMSFFFAANGRLPQRFHLSRSTGRMYMSDLLPTWHNKHPFIHSGEAVPFRFTPNMQNFITPIGIEGLLTSGIMAIGRGLTEPAYDLEQQLSLFLRDEVFAWYTTAQNIILPHDLTFRRSVQQNAETLVKKADLIACRTPTDVNGSSAQVPIQNITDLIVRASQEQQLAQMEITYLPWMCVNALAWSPDGELLLSSGDDCRLLVWKHDPSFSRTSNEPDAQSSSINLRCVTAIRTGHTDNVFSAQLLATGSSLVATCARDRQVRIFDLERAGGTSTKDIGYGVGEAGSEAMVHLLKCHTRQVKRVVTEQSPSAFLTVAGDHTVRQHDLRSPHTCPRCPTPLVKVPHALHALALSSITPWYFVVAGESKYGHLFDRRMIGRNLQDEWGAGGRLNESDDLVTCVARFGRDPAKEERDHHPHVTGARMAQTNGHELLLSYSGDAVYQYSIYDTPPTQGKSPILPSNKVASPKRPSSQPGKNQSPKEPTFALDELLAGHMDASSDEEEDEEDISDEDSDSDEMSEDGDETTPAALERPIILPMKDYRGAANVRTVKDVNFLGPNDEFVTSGSDDGNWFLWSKKTGELVGIWEGDGSVVNMVEGHPFLPIVAVSGIDETVKIFEPTPGNKRRSRLGNVQQIIEENQSANDNPDEMLDRSVIAALHFLRTAGRLPEIEGGPECRTHCAMNLFWRRAPWLSKNCQPASGVTAPSSPRPQRAIDKKGNWCEEGGEKHTGLTHWYKSVELASKFVAQTQTIRANSGTPPAPRLPFCPAAIINTKYPLPTTTFPPLVMLDEVWEPSRKRPRQDSDDFRREHLSYEHIPPPAHSREHQRRTPDRHMIEPGSWDRRRSSDSHWQHPVRDPYQADPSTDDLESSHDPPSRIIYANHRTNGSSSTYHRGMSRSHHPRLERGDPVQRHDSREWIPRDAVAKRGDTWPPKQDEPRPEPSAGTGDRTWTASEGWTRENSKSAAAARASDSRNSPPPRQHVPQAKVYNRTSHHPSTNWRDTHDDDIAPSRHHQTGGPSRVGEGWRERQIRRDRDNGRRFVDRREKGPIPQRRPPKWSDRSNHSPPPESRAAGKRRHTSYSPSPSRRTDRSRSPARSVSRSPSRSRSRSPDRTGYRTRSLTRSRSRSRSITSRSYSRSRSRSRSPGRRRTGTHRPRSRSPDSRWQKRTKKRKNQRGGHEYISSDKRVRRDRSADSNRQRSRRRSVSTTSTRSRSDSGESEKRRTEAAKRPVHRLPESSRNKALEISPVAPQRLNGFNQQKARPPVSPTMLRNPATIPRNPASEAEPPPNEGGSGSTNGISLPTSAIPTGPRSMATALSLPTTHVEPPPPSAPAGKPISPITLKPSTAKAPSRTVKMFFPGDDEDEDAMRDAGSKANLVPPVKDAPTISGPAGSSRTSEFVASRLSNPSTATSPTTSPSFSRPSAGSSPLQRTNGSTPNHAAPQSSASSQNNRPHPSSAKPISPDMVRVARDEVKQSAAASLAGTSSMPPPASVRPRLNHTQEATPPALTAHKSSIELHPASTVENKSLRATSSSSTPKRPDRPPTKPPNTVSDYQIICQVGEGTFGKVYKARSMSHADTFVALKRIRMEGEKDGFPVTAMREIKLLQSLRHENVINLHEMMVSKGNVFMVFEYMDHDLTGVLSQTQFSFTPAHLKSLCAQMLSGLAYLHQKGVIHRDMKGSNILLNNYGELKLGDFGLARFYSKRRRSDYTNRVITLWYRPPELLLGATVYGPEVDMWSAGCIMLELFTTKPAFQGNDEIHQLDAISRVMGTPDVGSWPGLIDMPWFELVKPPEPVKSHFRSSFNKYLSPAALDLAESLLTYDPNKRASAAQALEAPYFVSESPPPEKPAGLASIEGEWHEYESKREREKLRKKRKEQQ